MYFRYNHDMFISENKQTVHSTMMLMLSARDLAVLQHAVKDGHRTCVLSCNPEMKGGRCNAKIYS